MTMHSTKGRTARWPWFALPAALLAGACNQDQLLKVNTPDQITPDQTASAAGAQALRVSAVGNFVRFYSADIGGGGIALNLTTGIFADEAYTARSGTEHLDSRAQNNANFPANAPWQPFGTAFNQNVRARRALVKYPPTAAGALNNQLGQLYMLQGFTFTMMAEAYCNGIPVSDVNDDSPSSTNMTNA